ncbi:hypothetical protein GH714_016291 [Hevea brasiliensis]|uniref:Uncharacterized protein n=1 Tax=Hevea brasiliensis TaxID=3981 RepID=A0A6A6KS45_HEVBR|nr:hypothetical protein GH714_016291 [Hevea brasiliensis]
MLGCEEELVTGQELQMSLNAMRGTPGAQTMCVAGTCGKRSLQVLIDTGSTHNFLDSHIARKVGCELVKVTGVVVEVANGQELQCEHFCKEFTWCMQNQTFTTEVFILPLDSYDLILGASWLATLGEITWNFQTLQMKFWVDNKAHVLQGQNKHYLELTVNKQIHKLQKSHQVSSMQLVWHKEYWNSSQPIQLNALHATVSTWPELQQTLQDYADVFKDLKTLPPSRSHDHRIILKEGAAPVNARPYSNSTKWQTDPHLQSLILAKQQDSSSHIQYNWISGCLKEKGSWL